MVYFKWSVLIYIFNQYAYSMHLDQIKNNSHNAEASFERFCFARCCVTPLFCIYFGKSLISSILLHINQFDQKPRLNLGLPLQLGTGEEERERQAVWQRKKTEIERGKTVKMGYWLCTPLSVALWPAVCVCVCVCVCVRVRQATFGDKFQTKDPLVRDSSSNCSPIGKK